MFIAEHTSLERLAEHLTISETMTHDKVYLASNSFPPKTSV
jgi:hypothetical protein